MGDRIAILKAGGHLAQYATPAELLTAPADDFVEDFVGADRALKRLALMRVRDINLWEAPLAFVGQSTAEIRAKLDGAEVPHALVVDSERRPLGWLSESDLRADTVPEKPDSGPEPILDLDDVMRDALADLLQTETQYAPVTDAAAGSPACSPSRSSPSFSSPQRRRSRSTTRSSVRTGNEPGTRTVRASARPGDDPQQNGRQCPLPGPAGQGLLLRLGGRQLRSLHDATAEPASPGPDRRRHRLRRSLCDGAHLSPAPLARSQLHRCDRRPLHDPVARLHLPAPADHRARLDDGDHRAERLHAPDHLPEYRCGPQQRPGGQQGRRAGNGDDRPAAPLAGGAPPGPARDHRGASHRHRVDGGHRDPHGVRQREHAGRAALPADRLQDQHRDRRRALDPDGDRLRPDAPARPASLAPWRRSQREATP